MSSEADSVLLRSDNVGGVVTLTLNRPAQYNALSGEMLDELQQALDAIDRDESVRVVVIAANGKAFCPGHDLKEMRSSEEREFHQALFAKCSKMMLTINRLRQPVIARVNGYAIGGGHVAGQGIGGFIQPLGKVVAHQPEQRIEPVLDAEDLQIPGKRVSTAHRQDAQWRQLPVPVVF